jgi:two-component system chemotaxis response regulator CheY
MNGIEFIHAIRAGSQNKETPIVMVTSSTFESVRSKAMLAGAQAFLTKPLSPEDFNTKVLCHLPAGEP